MSQDVKDAEANRRSAKPINVLLELAGRRWVLRIVWELREGPLTARALRSRCDQAPPTSLQARLDDLRLAGFVELRPGAGYALTARGTAFLEAFMPLYAFAEDWLRPNDGGPNACLP